MAKPLFLLLLLVSCLFQSSILSQNSDDAISNYSFSKSIYNEDDYLKNKNIADNYFIRFSDKKHMPANELMAETALSFAGSPYTANTLDRTETEQLIVNLSEFDCTTFIESALALTLELKVDNPTFDGFESRLQKIRYKDGEIDGYLSRLHYMLDWISNNKNNKIIEDITLQLGGEPISKKINFMSKHADKYPQLKNSPQIIEELKKNENKINERIEQEGNFIILKKEKFKRILPKLQQGDIILFATKIEGLDYSHMGFIIYDEGVEPKLLHASSSKNKKVLVDKKSLIEYLTDSPNCSGVSILRLKN